ncbi:MAG: hypothetical protein KDN05_14870, partial [Verrucomicrobiae bacterium]|nr:hypothetical protein [Verrucomicrobiae bacterium]
MLKGQRLVHFHPLLADAALFQEGESVRLSQNDPDGNHIAATFFGLTQKGLTISVPAQADIARQDAWTLDEDVIDLTDFYLKALAELAATSHGRDAVLPALLDETGGEIDFEAHAESCDALDDSGLDDSQIDAVANCLAADRFHLVQGPPGTGKTFAL